MPEVVQRVLPATFVAGTGRRSGRRGPLSRCWMCGLLRLVSRLGPRDVIPGARAALHGWAARLPGPPAEVGRP